MHVEAKPLLDQDEMIRLCVAAQAGDIEARNEMVTRNMRLVYMLARSVSRHSAVTGMSHEDAVQAGVIGLMRAIAGFDTALGIAFSTYAYRAIIQDIRRLANDCNSMIRIPKYLSEHIDHLDYSGPKVATWKKPACNDLVRFARLARNFRAVGLVNAKVDLLENCPSTDDRSDMCESDHTETVALVMGCLNTKQRQVIVMRYGLEGYRPHLRREIGEVMELCRDYVRQVEVGALNAMREFCEGHNISLEI
jgi:RNA polymerase sigma factor (sigma-70 family)